VVDSLSGNGVTPLYTITPLINNFGNQLVNTTSSAITLTVTNTALSQGELWITGAPTVTGTNANQFQATVGTGAGECTVGRHLPIGGTCTISVVFTPTSAGCKGGLLGICPNIASNTTVNIGKASGTGVGAGVTGVGGTTTTRTVTPATFATFPTTARGSQSAPQSLTVTNTGFNPIPVTSIGFTGANTTYWTQTTTCGASIPVNGSCTVTVRFAPPAAGTTGAHNSNLQIVDGVGTTNRAVNGTAN
jgi:hypothetical protein